MTTLNDTQKPDVARLEQILPAALSGRSEAQFINDYLSGMSHCLASDPRYYRSLGPWWPALKTLLIEAGNVTAGTEVDEDVSGYYQYDRPALTAVAAYLYQQMRMNAGLLFSSNHLLAVPENVDDEPYEFTSYDLELESKVSQTD